MGELSIWHWLIVVAVFVLLFGAKKLPDAARGIGRSMRILKSELRHEDSEPPADYSPPASQTPAPPAAQLPPAQPQVTQQHVADQQHVPPAGH